MRFSNIGLLAAILMAGSVVAAGTAYAAPDVGQMADAGQQAELQQLSPAARQQALARATGGDSLQGVLTTMQLNHISARYAAEEVVATPLGQGVIAVTAPGGHTTDIPFSVASVRVEG